MTAILSKFLSKFKVYISLPSSLVWRPPRKVSLPVCQASLVLVCLCVQWVSYDWVDPSGPFRSHNYFFATVAESCPKIGITYILELKMTYTWKIFHFAGGYSMRIVKKWHKLGKGRRSLGHAKFTYRGLRQQWTAIGWWYWLKNLLSILLTCIL